MASYGLVEVDSIEITVLVDNEVDPITPSNNPAVQYSGLMQGVPLDPLPPDGSRGDAQAELKMSNICCGAHGLSLMITATKDTKSHTILFDTGPEEHSFTRNAQRTRAQLARIEHIHLSHWHTDHSGGMLAALRLINAAKNNNNNNKQPIPVDLHPDRPDHRGMLNSTTGAIISLEADPTFAAIEAAGGRVVTSPDTHAVLDGFFLASGAIPRRTEYEVGIRGAVRFSSATQTWVPDEAIADERLVMCHLKGKGLVVFTGCSHAGVVNVCRHAVELGGGGGEVVPLYGVVGGFHLAENQPEKLARSLEDLKALEPRVLMPGHCTGWRFKFMCEQAMPAVIAPSFCGTTYTLQ
ncbi:hypothetical protein N0V82_004086 [Gnomoniopsis sp. IMI 355080]|nr:hypothetical protein N0V82_004086 [Gnomoniopsis sp. IMI 355080]